MKVFICAAFTLAQVGFIDPIQFDANKILLHFLLSLLNHYISFLNSVIDFAFCNTLANAIGIETNMGVIGIKLLVRKTG